MFFFPFYVEFVFHMAKVVHYSHSISYMDFENI